ncbi:pyridoxamine 5'-phosphate oxidase family protein [Nocardioides sp. DS6]|uniref:Pyridoxamine 5'-phosphate oxidase family protein n=1 Tax=Nocardioides eburneus TaxID=3231482 RepID=A0ABV3T3H9_9ACTN
MTTEGARHLTELDEHECWRRLGDGGVGRLAWSGAQGPTVVPVNYRVDGREVQIRTAAYSSLARETEDSLVAFEADRIDEATHTGWSVLVRGRMTFDYAAPASEGPHPWPEGARRLRMAITPTSVTGRQVG